MPRFDGTGPTGIGPGTGRRLGPCFGFGTAYGRRGLGRYFNWRWPQNKKDQKKALTDYKKALEEELEDAKRQLEELGK
jgi:hypothetical protein